MESRRFNTSAWNFLVVLWCACFLVTAAPGAKALRLLNDPPQLISSHAGMNVDFNCTTDDPNATVSLLFSNNFGATWPARSVSQNKLALRGQVFTLMSLTYENGGQYKCKANDTSGQTVTWKEPVLLFVLPAELPRYFELIPDKQIYVWQGHDGKVTCECNGVAIATLKWEKETGSRKSYEAVPDSWVTYTKDLASNRVIAVLKIPNAQLSDSGVYKCTVMVNQKSDFKLTYVRVKAPEPPTILPYTGGTVIKEESTKVVKCTAKGFPKPTASWYRNGKKLKTKRHSKDPKTCEYINFVYKVYEEGEDISGLHTIYTVQVLEIRSASYPRDHGEFKCVASNGLSPDAELNIDFHVQVKLANHFKLRPGKPITVLQGQEAKLKCESDIDSVTKLQWKKQTYLGDVPVPDSMVVRDRSNERIRAILKIKYTDIQDSGVYKCVLTAFGKTESKQTIITVKESFAFKNKPQDVIQGYLGQNAVINCSTNDEDADVFLLRKPHPFAPYTIRQAEANKLSKEGQVFTILNIDIWDAGKYACAARNKKNQTIQWPRYTGYFFLSQR